MPRLIPTSDEQIFTIPGTGNFQFSGTRLEHLQELMYSLITIVVDRSGSTQRFQSDLLKMVKAVVQACRKNPKAENLLIRLVKFNQNVEEIHGFRPLSSINEDDYEEFDSDGWTALYDGTFDGIGSEVEYAKVLTDKDYYVNGAVYIITDALNNRGIATPTMIKEKVEQATHDEAMESLLTILIGLNDPQSSWNKEVARELASFKENANLDSFIELGDATPSALAKLGNFISESISSTSQNLSTGMKSQKLTF